MPFPLNRETKMPQSSIIPVVDQTLLATFMTLAGLFLADLGLFLGISLTNREGKSKLIILVVGNVILWGLANLAIFFAITPQALAINIILLLNIILTVVLFIGAVVYFIVSSQNRKLSHLIEVPSEIQYYGLHFIDTDIIPRYINKKHVTLTDKKDAMSDVLQKISVTTVPSTIENLVRIALFEVRSNGHFRILAAHNIDAHRILRLEREFRYAPDPEGMVSRAVIEKHAILVKDLLNKKDPYTKYWKPTPENDLPAQKASGIMCIPVFSNNENRHECLAVISVSCSKANFLTEEHQKQVEAYAERIRTLLVSFKDRILFDVDVSTGIRAITISGEVASGKTSLVTELSSILKPFGWSVIHVGDIFRQFCEQRHISIQEVGKLPDEIHFQFDEYQKLMLSQEDHLIVEGRLSGYVAHDLKDVLKIYCSLEETERVKRYARRAEVGLAQAEIDVRTRDTHDLEKYRSLYKVPDYRAKEFYDLYLPTTTTPSNLAKEVIKFMNEMLATK